MPDEPIETYVDILFIKKEFKKALKHEFLIDDDDRERILKKLIYVIQNKDYDTGG